MENYELYDSKTRRYCRVGSNNLSLNIHMRKRFVVDKKSELKNFPISNRVKQIIVNIVSITLFISIILMYYT